MKKHIPQSFGYAVFAGTSTLLAFFLTAALIFIPGNLLLFEPWLLLALMDLFLFSCLYHGWYRAKTLVTDLGATGKTRAAWRLFLHISFAAGLLMLVAVNISNF